MMPGLARLTEEVASEVPQRDLADALWRLIIGRGYVDIDRARPFLDRDHTGLLVYARAVPGGRSLVVVDTGDRLLGVVGPFNALPRVGSAIRLLAPSGLSIWRLVADEALPLPVNVRFDRAPTPGYERVWLDSFAAALPEIERAEAARRAALALRRRSIPPFRPVPVKEDFEGSRARAIAANEKASIALQLIEDADAASRGRTAACAKARAWLTELAAAPFVVEGVERAVEGVADPRRAQAVLRTIALLVRAMPRCAARAAV